MAPLIRECPRSLNGPARLMHANMETLRHARYLLHHGTVTCGQPLACIPYCEVALIIF
jgi:hypothetical protein